MLIAEFNAIRRRSAEFTDRWEARGKCIYDEMQTLIAQVSRPEIAEHIVEQHNSFMQVCNLVVMAIHKWRDARAQNKEYEATLEAVTSCPKRVAGQAAARSAVGHRKH